MQAHNSTSGSAANSPFTNAGNQVQVKQKRSFPKIGTALLLLTIVSLQVIAIYFVVNPPYLQQQNLTRQVMAEVSEKVEVNPFETPIVSVVADAENLKNANGIQAEVYAGARDGDFVLGYSDKMVIYRRETGEIIYQGDSPGTILNKNQQTLTQSVLGVATARGFVNEGEDVTPQLSVVTDPAVLKSQDPVFYESAQQGDIIAIFPSKQLILLVRSDSNGGTTIIQSGNYNTEINPN